MGMFDDLIPQGGPSGGGMFDDLIPQKEEPSKFADVAKQLGAGIATGVEAIPTTVPILTGLAGQGAQALLDKFAPGFTDPQKLQNQQKLVELAAQARNGGIAQYLPQPETTAGEAARSVGSFIPSALGLSGGVARNTLGAVGAGLGSFAGEKVAPSEEAKPYLQLGGALLGGAAGLRGAESIASRVASKAVPSAEKIGKVAEEAYGSLREAHNLQPIKQSDLDYLAANLTRALNKSGPRPSVAEGIHRAIEEIKTPATSGAPDVADLVAARQNIKSFFQTATPDPNKAGAAKVLPLIDATIERLSPGTMKTLRDADKNYAASKTAATLDKRIVRAEMRAAGEHSGLNLGNKIRQNAANMLLSNKESRGLTAAEESALTAVNKGTLPQNAMRFASNMLGGGGGLGTSLLALGAGGGIGYGTGHPELAGLPILGIGLRALSNRSIANQAGNVSAQIRSRSPHAQSVGITAPKKLTEKQVAALAALYSIPALHGLGPISGPGR